MRTKSMVVMLMSALMLAGSGARVADAHVTVRNADYQITGLYNLKLIGVKTGVEQRVDLILDQGLDGYRAVLLSEQHTVALEEVRFEGETLHGMASTSAGRAELTLRITPDGITGTMKIGKHTIRVKGERAL